MKKYFNLPRSRENKREIEMRSVLTNLFFPRRMFIRRRRMYTRATSIEGKRGEGEGGDYFRRASARYTNS